MNHIIEIPEINYLGAIPKTLADCTQKQYIDMSGLIYQYISGEISYEQLRLVAVYKLFELKQSKKKLSETDEINKWANLNEISVLIDSFFETNEDGQKTIIQNYIHNPIPSIALWHRYHGPTNQFLNIKFGEYVDALRLYQEFPTEMGTTKHLYLIAAILYRRKKPFHFIKKRLNSYNVDMRVDYNPKLLDANALKLQYLPISVVYGIYLYFASFQKFISTATIPWGGRWIDFSILFETKSNDNEPDEVPGLGMDSILYTLAESGAFGNTEAVRNTDLWEILIRMYDLRKKDLDQQKQQAKNDQATKP
jgi:hypothetical protein